MTINDRNRFAFSYTSHDVRDKKFIYKNYNKTSSYNSNFSHCIFQSTSFVGSKFKFCSLYGAIFKNCLIRGALFKKCNLQTAEFTECIIAASVFERAKLQGCKFINCKIIGSTNLKGLISDENLTGTEFFERYPNLNEFNSELVIIIERLREHDFIRRSTVLHRKKGKIDTISLQILVEEFGEDYLIANLDKAASSIKAEFHTLTYIQNMLRKLQLLGRIKFPRSCHP